MGEVRVVMKRYGDCSKNLVKRFCLNSKCMIIIECEVYEKLLTKDVPEKLIRVQFQTD